MYINYNRKKFFYRWVIAGACVALLLTVLFLCYLNRIYIIEPLTIEIQGRNPSRNKDVSVILKQPLGKEIPVERVAEHLNIWKLNQNGISYYNSVEVHLKSSQNLSTDTFDIRVYNEQNESVYAVPALTEQMPLTLRQFNHINLAQKANSVLGFSFFYALLALVLFVLIVSLIRNEKVFVFLNMACVVFIIIWGYVWLVKGALHAFPNAEDISLASDPRKFGILEAVKLNLIHFDGRYFTNILHGLSLLALASVYAFKYAVIITILLSVLSHLFFFYVWWGKSMPLYKIMLFSLLFCLSHFILIPSLPHSLYFLSSSFVYLYSWIFFLFFAGFLVLYYKAKSLVEKTVFFTLTSFFLVFSMGINEMMLLFIPVALVTLLIHIYKNNRVRLTEFIPFLIIALACVWFFVQSPGLAKRYQSFDADNRIPFLLYITYTNVTLLFLSIFKWVANSFVFISFTLFITVYVFNKPEYLREFNLSVKQISGAIAGLMLLIIMISYAFYIPMGYVSTYPERLYNFINYIFQFIPYLLIPIFIRVRLLRNSPLSSLFTSRIVALCLFICSYLLVFGTNNISQIKNEYMSGNLEKFSCQMNKRYETINAAKEMDTWKVAVVDSLENIPAIIYSSPDIMPNRRPYFWNDAYETYFGLNEVRLKDDTFSLQSFFNKHAK
jgi:hypothetical protein